MRAGSLFTGCYGLDLGLEAAGIETAWACENDPACRRVLARRRPELRVYADVRYLPGDLAPVDLLVGGFPCQDLSEAGRGGGLDGSRSGLWRYMAGAVRLLRPRFVLVENVPGLATKMGSRPGESALGTVIADLAEAGYLGVWIRLRASDLGAPHERERIFIHARLPVAADAYRERRRQVPGGAPEDEGEPPRRAEDEDHVAGRTSPSGLPTAGSPAPPDAGRERRDRPRGRDEDGEAGADREPDGRSGAPGSRSPAPDWGIYSTAVERWERILGRPAPRPTDDRGRLMPGFVEWMLGFPDGWTEGVSRTARLRMLGNAVQVQVGELVGRRLVEIEKEVAA